jgi:hypothetical protein
VADPPPERAGGAGFGAGAEGGCCAVSAAAGGGGTAAWGAGADVGTGGGGGGTWRPATASATSTSDNPSRPQIVASSQARAGRNSLPALPEGSGRLHIASNRSESRRSAPPDAAGAGAGQLGPPPGPVDRGRGGAPSGRMGWVLAVATTRSRSPSTVTEPLPGACRCARGAFDTFVPPKKSHPGEIGARPHVARVALPTYARSISANDGRRSR